MFQALLRYIDDPLIRSEYLQNPGNVAPRLRRDAEETMRNILVIGCISICGAVGASTTPIWNSSDLLRIEYEDLPTSVQRRRTLAENGQTRIAG